jgi:2C-methyl-D-erythritol 2,4-cyclodiphosphate synthase
LANPETKFEDLLFKRIKNAKKKLRQIEELEEKMKDKEYQANEAQREKLASRPKLEAELNEVRSQAVMYLEAKRDDAKKTKKELEKLEVSSKKNAVRSVASILSMSTVLQKGHSLDEDGE